MDQYSIVKEVKYAMLNPHLINLTGTKGDLDLIINLANGQALLVQITSTDAAELKVNIALRDYDYRIVKT